MIVSLYDDLNYYVVTLLYGETVMRWPCYVIISPQFNTTENKILVAAQLIIIFLNLKMSF